MASNPFQSARESLVSLFDENRKKVIDCNGFIWYIWVDFVTDWVSLFKYEQQERKRRESKDASSRKKEAASAMSDAARVDRRELRREIWIHPLDGRRTRRTTSTSGAIDCNPQNSDDEELAQLPSIEVCVRTISHHFIHHFSLSLSLSSPLFASSWGVDKMNCEIVGYHDQRVGGCQKTTIWLYLKVCYKGANLRFYVFLFFLLSIGIWWPLEFWRRSWLRDTAGGDTRSDNLFVCSWLLNINVEMNFFVFCLLKESALPFVGGLNLFVKIFFVYLFSSSSVPKFNRQIVREGEREEEENEIS